MLSDQLEQCLRHHTRSCHGLPDMTFVLSCLKRVITQNQSGRDFLQFIDEADGQNLKRSTFFDALKSQRRLHAVSEMSKLHHKLLSNLVTCAGVDLLAGFPELDDYEVLSADGHFIEHPSHVKKENNRKVYAAGNIYAQNIRNGLTQFLTPVTDRSAKEHELPHFKQAVDMVNSTKKLYGFWIVLT